MRTPSSLSVIAEKQKAFDGGYARWYDFKAWFQATVIRERLNLVIDVPGYSRGGAGLSDDLDDIEEEEEDDDDSSASSRPSTPLKSPRTREEKKKARAELDKTSRRAAVKERAESAKLYKANADVWSILVFGTTGMARNLVAQYPSDGQRAWEALCARYEPTGPIGQRSLMRELTTFKMDSNGDPEVLFADIERVRTRLHNMKQILPDDIYINSILSALPSAYEGVISNIQYDDNITYEQAKNRVRTQFFALQDKLKMAKQHEEIGKAYYTNFKGACSHCGEHGHLKKDCKKKQQQQKTKSSGNSERTGGGGGFSKGYGKGKDQGQGGKGAKVGGKSSDSDPIVCYKCGKLGHRAPDCRSTAPGGAAGGGGGAGDAANYVVDFNFNVTYTLNTEIPFYDVIDSAHSTCQHLPRYSPNTFIADSGCSNHMVDTTTTLVNIQPASGYVVGAGGQRLAVTGCGEYRCMVRTQVGKHVGLHLKTVLIVPGLGRSLLSAKRMAKSNHFLVLNFHGGAFLLGGSYAPEATAVLREADDLYLLDTTPWAAPWHVKPYVSDDPVSSAYAATHVPPDLWHSRCGHRNLADLQRLGQLNVGVPPGLKCDKRCDICEQAKHVRPSYHRNADYQTTTPLQLVFSDVAGPFPEPSLTGARYMVSFVDAHTRFLRVYFVKSKGEALQALQTYEREMAVLLRGQRIKQLVVEGLRTDNGREYDNKAFVEYCTERMITHSFTGPYTPEQNGVAERVWRTIMNIVRSLLIESGLPKCFWSLAAATSVYILNRMPHSALDGDTPYHKLLGRHAHLQHLRVFGCRAFVREEPVNRDKLDPRAWAGIFVGYCDKSKCYLVYNLDTQGIHRSTNVTFFENSFPFKTSSTTSPAEVPVGAEASVGAAVPPVPPAPTPATPPPPDPELHDVQTDLGQQDPTDPEPQPSRRTRASRFCQDPQCPEARHGPHMHDEAFHLSYAEVYNQIYDPNDSPVNFGFALHAATTTLGDPQTYRDAMESPDADKWHKAWQEELQALIDNKTWAVVELPPDKTPIGSRVIFKAKRDETGSIYRYKARLVAQGFKQVPGRDYMDTYAPVSSLSSIRTVLALATAHDWDLFNMDVDTAFLNSPVDEELYVRLPTGHGQGVGPSGREYVLRLLKSIYGLKQSPRNWHALLDTWLKDFGLTPAHADPCVYVLHDPQGGLLIVIIYVDDLIITGNSHVLINTFKLAISKRFHMKDLGALRWVLGMEVRRDRAARTLELKQTAYFDILLNRFGMSDCHPTSTPIALGELPRLEGGKPDPLYMSIVGSLMYAAMGSRPDLINAIKTLSPHLQSSGPQHLKAAKHTLHYIQGTRDLGIKFSGYPEDNALKLIGFSDASYGDNNETGRSTTGYLFQLASGPVSWSSRLQPTVALSTTEAEYMAACATTCEALHLRQLLADLQHAQPHATIIFEDNQSCIALSNNHIYHKRSKHINVRFHFTRDAIKANLVKLVYVPTEYQLADLMTKALPRQRIEALRARVLGYK